tara:strand:+ start:1118 stop:1459 length:342 start_codon:yes stop_codon:yes gene_type:complete
MKDNKLIAEFMGVHDEISLDSIAGNIHSWSDAPFFYITEDSKEKVMEGITKYSKYHTEWNWLMPVGEKIDAMFGEDDEVDDAINRVHNAVLSFDIDNTYRAIVEFIEDYNDEK